MQFKLSQNDKQKQNDDLGLGSKVSVERNMNKDGSFNVVRAGEPKYRFYEVYHMLIAMPWLKFFTIIISTYCCSNLIFATIYYSLGVEHLTGIDTNASELHKFLDAFFFSSQTLTTVGFGRIAPVGTATSIVAAIESMLGVLVFAIATGLLYGRFSRPSAKILYSECALIAPYRDGKGLMIRLANMRRNQLIEVEINVSASYIEKGATSRSFTRLNLERDKINLFPTSWTVVHPIDSSSPFFEASTATINEMKMELIVLVKAFDDTFSQTIYSRTSYHAKEIFPDKKFLPMVSTEESGRTILDLRKMNDTVEASS